MLHKILQYLLTALMLAGLFWTSITLLSFGREVRRIKMIASQHVKKTIIHLALSSILFVAAFVLLFSTIPASTTDDQLGMTTYDKVIQMVLVTLLCTISWSAVLALTFGLRLFILSKIYGSQK